MAKSKQQIWTIIFEVLKAIFTLGISHINKRKQRLEDVDDSTTQS